jgi:enamine deaminase RidA (YjgF/YER057c/UK114 family)
VPGWFQATVALYDSAGREVAFADDYRFDPDPVLFYRIEKDGEYRVEIRDALFRGRDDFVYRVQVGELPFITGIYPLGSQADRPFTSWIYGWNLPCKTVQFDTKAGLGTIRQVPCKLGERLSNPVTYAVTGHAETHEAEPNNDVGVPQAIALPVMLNGSIAEPGDTDYYQFTGRAGERIIAETQARRLNSPLDSLLRITDSTGRILATNDDSEDKASGLLTHHADSLLSATLPADGQYCIQVSDAQRQGSPVYGYRLRVSTAQPDFELRVVPSTVNLPPGRTAPVWVHVLRKDGFDGEVNVNLAHGAREFALAGGRIPPGQQKIRMTLSAVGQVNGPTILRLQGSASIGGKMVVRDVVPAENMMQAFAYQHLVPMDQFVAAPLGASRGGQAIQLTDSGPVSIPLGGTAQVQVRAPFRAMLRQVDLALSDPPEGITLQKVTPGPAGLSLTLKADATSATVGLADNLIVEAFNTGGGSASRPGANQGRQRISLGMLPGHTNPDREAVRNRMQVLLNTKTEYFNVDCGNLAVVIYVSRFQGPSGVDEYHFSIRPTEYDTIDKQLAWVMAGYERALAQFGLSADSAVLRRFSCSDLANQAPVLEKHPVARNDAPGSPTAISWINQPPAPPAKVEFWAYHISDPVGLDKSRDGLSVVMRRGELSHYWTAGMTCVNTESAHDQTRIVLGKYDSFLASHGMTLADNVLRTWFFVQNIDSNYKGFVVARREFFNERGLTPETHFIASTGIEGTHRDVAAKIAMDAYAVGGIRPEQVEYLSARDHLSPTHVYGVTFERGTAIAYRDRRHVIISGTASIDHQGRIVHPGDVSKQLDRTMENVEALLKQAGATLADMAVFLVYVRDLSDYELVRCQMRERFGDAPIQVVVAPVCRPGWLVEVEGKAVIPANNPELPGF